MKYLILSLLLVKALLYVHPPIGPHEPKTKSANSFGEITYTRLFR